MDYITISELAKNLGLTRKRVHQLIGEKGYWGYCKRVGTGKRTPLILAPIDLFAEYVPSKRHQEAGALGGSAGRKKEGKDA